MESVRSALSHHPTDLASKQICVCACVSVFVYTKSEIDIEIYSFGKSFVWNSPIKQIVTNPL